MRLLLLAPVLALTACAQESQQPLNDAQRAMLLQYMLNNKPAQTEFHPLQIQPLQRQWHCTTTPIGDGQTRSVCY